jgi:acyl-CoA dehydrogenase
MIEWSEQHLMIRDMMRRFIDEEIKPRWQDLEHGELPPYDILRTLMRTFGLDEMARQRFARQIEREKAAAESKSRGETAKARRADGGDADGAGLALIPIIELCRWCPGMVTAMGVSVGLTAAAVMSKGTIAQKERWGLKLLTLEAIGSWAITEPGSGSDAFGGMKSTARRDGDGYVLNGSKTFITNGPYADTIVFICKLDDGADPKHRKVLSFVLDRGMAGLTQSKPMRKMGMHSSPTGELFLEDVRCGRDRLIGETEDAPARSGAKATFSMERSGVAAMALGIVEECLALCLDYSRTRVQFGKPIGENQALQHRASEMMISMEQGRSLAMLAAIMVDDANAAQRAHDLSTAKVGVGQAARFVSQNAVQLHGGIGMTEEYAVGHYFRRCMVIEHNFGDTGYHLSRLAAAVA